MRFRQGSFRFGTPPLLEFAWRRRWPARFCDAVSEERERSERPG